MKLKHHRQFPSKKINQYQNKNKTVREKKMYLNFSTYQPLRQVQNLLRQNYPQNQELGYKNSEPISIGRDRHSNVIKMIKKAKENNSKKSQSQQKKYLKNQKLSKKQRERTLSGNYRVRKITSREGQKIFIKEEQQNIQQNTQRKKKQILEFMNEKLRKDKIQKQSRKKILQQQLSKFKKRSIPFTYDYDNYELIPYNIDAIDNIALRKIKYKNIQNDKRSFSSNSRRNQLSRKTSKSNTKAMSTKFAYQQINLPKIKRQKVYNNNDSRQTSFYPQLQIEKEIRFREEQSNKILQNPNNALQTLQTYKKRGIDSSCEAYFLSQIKKPLEQLVKLKNEYLIDESKELKQSQSPKMRKKNYSQMRTFRTGKKLVLCNQIS